MAQSWPTVSFKLLPKSWRGPGCACTNDHELELRGMSAIGGPSAARIRLYGSSPLSFRYCADARGFRLAMWHQHKNNPPARFGYFPK